MSWVSSSSAHKKPCVTTVLIELITLHYISKTSLCCLCIQWVSSTLWEREHSAQVVESEVQQLELCCGKVFEQCRCARHFHSNGFTPGERHWDVCWITAQGTYLSYSHASVSQLINQYTKHLYSVIYRKRIRSTCVHYFIALSELMCPWALYPCLVFALHHIMAPCICCQIITCAVVVVIIIIISYLLALLLLLLALSCRPYGVFCWTFILKY